MKIIKIAGIFKEPCPHCGAENEINVEAGSLIVCEECNGTWETSLITKKFEDTPPAFRNSPTPLGPDRRIRE
jgi:hypothetical protein